MNWKYKINIKNFKGSFEKVKQEVFKRLNESDLFDNIDIEDSLILLKDSENLGEFDEHLSDIYDYCDNESIWLDLYGTEVSE